MSIIDNVNETYVKLYTDCTRAEDLLVAATERLSLFTKSLTKLMDDTVKGKDE